MQSRNSCFTKLITHLILKEAITPFTGRASLVQDTLIGLVTVTGYYNSESERYGPMLSSVNCIELP
jgi:hypothetical protein